MENKKQEAVKAAWQVYGIPFGNYIDDNGFIKMSQNLPDAVDSLIIDVQFSNRYNNEFSLQHGKLRPKSLQGIEDNNGWIPIIGLEKEIPLGTGAIHLFNFDTKEEYISISDKEFIEIGRFTHYQPIVKPLPPIH